MLGVKLFERLGRRITLTQEAERLIPYAEQILKLITLLPETAVKQEVETGQLVQIPWVGSEFRIITQLVYHKDKWMSPTLKSFIELTCQMLLARNISSSKMKIPIEKKSLRYRKTVPFTHEFSEKLKQKDTVIRQYIR